MSPDTDKDKITSDLVRYLKDEGGPAYEQQLIGRALSAIRDLQLKVMSLEAACKAGDKFLVVQAEELARLTAEREARRGDRSEGTAGS